jgi:hypothetical protein
MSHPFTAHPFTAQTHSREMTYAGRPSSISLGLSKLPLGQDIAPACPCDPNPTGPPSYHPLLSSPSFNIYHSRKTFRKTPLPLLPSIPLTFARPPRALGTVTHTHRTQIGAVGDWRDVSEAETGWPVPRCLRTKSCRSRSSVRRCLRRGPATLTTIHVVVPSKHIVDDACIGLRPGVQTLAYGAAHR